MIKPHVIIIGAGFTGLATAHDLALRGLQVTVLERGSICNGTSGRTHGILHCGARYCVYDRESAIECLEENRTLRLIAPQTIEPNGGLFVALDGDDEEYIFTWQKSCEECHIPVRSIPRKKALELEPNLSQDIQSAFMVPDGTFDPLRLGMAFAATAKSNGAAFHLYHEATGFVLDNSGAVLGVETLNRTNGERVEFHSDLIVNAGGAWSGKIAALAGVNVPVKPNPGAMVAVEPRLVNLVISRLRAPTDGDVIVPQRRMIVIGTTSFEFEDEDYVPVFQDHIQLLLDEGARMVPAIGSARRRGAYMSTRPLIGAGSSGRDVARTFKCVDHKRTDNIEGFVTITGGKATTSRALAEAAADVVCLKLGFESDCRTRNYPLLSYRQFYTN